MPYGTSYISQATSSGGSTTPTVPSAWTTFASTKGADGTQISTTSGALVTPGVAGTMGTYTSLGVLHATVDMLEIEIVVHTVAVSTSNRAVMIDVAVDPAGGVVFNGNEKINNLLCGSPGSLQAGSETRLVFPLKVPAGASIGVRAVSLDATVTAFRVFVNGRGGPSQSAVTYYGTNVQTLGIATPGTPAGVTVVAGTASEGAWTAIGTLSQAIIGLEVGLQIDNTAMASAMLEYDVAIGDAGTKRIYASNRFAYSTTNEVFARPAGNRITYVSGASGETVYVRAQSNGGVATLSAAAYGVY